jgi:ATP-dependent DNA helicase RecG
MTITELLEAIRNGENSGIEFKRDDIDNRELAKELVALTNHWGGSVLLGVEDDGSISGVNREKLEEWVMLACRDKIRPEIIPFYQLLRDVADGKDVAIITVAPGYTVHARWHNQLRTYYIRVGTIVREASPEELERLFQQRGSFRAELRAISGAPFEELDLRRLKEYFTRVRGQQSPGDDDRAAWIRLLINTEIMANQVGNDACTLGGLLLFGRNAHRFLNQAGIDAVAYHGNEADYDTRERSLIRGPMVALGPPDGIVENGLVEQAIAFVTRHLPNGEALIGAQRASSQGFPVSVLREAIVNALVHRDYLLSATNIQLSIFANRLEIVSPGRPPNGISVERMLAGCRAARNQLIVDMMRDYGYLEHMGMGVPRKLVIGMREFNDTEPELDPQEEGFRVVLHR